MRKIILLLALLFGFTVFGQDKFVFDKSGLTPFIITNVEGKSNNEIYQKLVNWVKETFRKPDFVFDAQIENESVRFTGWDYAFTVYNGFGDPMNLPLYYTIKVSVKDGKYKMEVIDYYAKHEMIDYSDIKKKLYKKNGELFRCYRDSPSSIENKFNSFNESLKNYILSKSNSEW